MTLPASFRARELPVFLSPGVCRGLSSSSGFLDVRPKVVSVFLPPHGTPWRSSTDSDQLRPLLPRLSFFVAMSVPLRLFHRALHRLRTLGGRHRREFRALAWRLAHVLRARLAAHVLRLFVRHISRPCVVSWALCPCSCPCRTRPFSPFPAGLSGRARCTPGSCAPSWLPLTGLSSSSLRASGRPGASRERSSGRRARRRPAG